MLNIIDEWTLSLDLGGQIDCIYMDFEKAFDKVPYRRLISKLLSYGINSNIIAWISDFLDKRQFRVIVNDKFSSWHDVLSGIPVVNTFCVNTLLTNVTVDLVDRKRDK